MAAVQELGLEKNILVYFTSENSPHLACVAGDIAGARNDVLTTEP